MSLSVIPFEILLMKMGSVSVFHKAVSAAVIPLAILLLKSGSDSVTGVLSFSAVTAYIA